MEDILELWDEYSPVDNDHYIIVAKVQALKYAKLAENQALIGFLEKMEGNTVLFYNGKVKEFEDSDEI